MAKGLNGKELGTGIRQREGGRYEARATINGITIGWRSVRQEKAMLLLWEV